SRVSLPCSALPRHLHSFPTRRSSDLTPSIRLSLSKPAVTAAVRAVRSRISVPNRFGPPVGFPITRTGALVSVTVTVPLPVPSRRSEEHTSELQSQSNLVCRLLLEKKK